MMSKHIFLFVVAGLMTIYAQISFGHGEAIDKSLLNVKNSNGTLFDVSVFILKSKGRSFEFIKDTASAEYKHVSQMDKRAIKSLEVLKNKQLHGDVQNVLVINLTNHGFSNFPIELERKFR